MMAMVVVVVMVVVVAAEVKKGSCERRILKRDIKRTLKKIDGMFRMNL